MDFITPKRVGALFKQITVEPVIFLYMWSSFQQYPTLQALIYKKTCLNIQKTYRNDSICDSLENKNYSAEDDYVQTESSKWIMYNNIAYTVPSIITVTLLLGPWGDRIGRKVPILIPTVGCIVFHVCNLINSLLMHLPIRYLLIGNILNGLSGGFIGMMMAVYSYIGDLVSKENRTVRVAVIEAMIFLAGCFGALFSGIILDNTSFVFAFSFIIGILGLTLAYSVFFIKDIKVTEMSQQTLCESLRLSAVDTFKCIGGRNGGRDVVFIILYILVLLILMLCTTGESDILYLYVKLPEFNMTTTLYGYFSALNNFLRGIGVLTLLPVLRYKWDIKDNILIYLGLISKCLGLILLAVAAETWQIFLVPVVSVLQGFPSAATRSSLSKSVEKNEQGKLFGIIASLESLSTFLATVIFNKIYPVSLNFFNGFCFLLAAFLTLLGFAIVFVASYRKSETLTDTYDTLQEDTGEINSQLEPNTKA